MQAIQIDEKVLRDFDCLSIEKRAKDVRDKCLFSV